MNRRQMLLLSFVLGSVGQINLADTTELIAEQIAQEQAEAEKTTKKTKPKKAAKPKRVKEKKQPKPKKTKTRGKKAKKAEPESAFMRRLREFFSWLGGSSDQPKAAKKTS